MKFLICLAVALCGILVGVWGVDKYRAGVNTTVAQFVMMRTPFWCPESSYVQYDGWGELDMAKNCFLIRDSAENGMVKNGPWEGWKAGRLVAKGIYSHRKRQGTFVFFADNETPTCRIEYDSDTLVSDSGNCTPWKD